MSNVFSMIRNGNSGKAFSFTLDHMIALLPMIAVSTVFFGEGLIVRCGISMLCACAFQLFYSLLFKKQFDLTIIFFSFAAAMPLGLETPLWIYVLLGVTVAVFSELRGYMGKYITIESVTFALFVKSSLQRNVKYDAQCATSFSRRQPWKSSLLN